MNLLHHPPAPPADSTQRFRLSGVPWEAYEKLLDAFAEHHVRMTYDRGELELMSPLPIHELYKVAFGHLFFVLAEELRIRFRSLGSTTFRRQDVERGIEPDECYYLASTAKVTDWRTLDLSRDPPPDLAIEIDVTRNCLDRMGVYAALNIPEVWRFDGEAVQAFRLTGGAYEATPVSLALPFLPLAEIAPLLQQDLTASDTLETIQAMRAWVRERVLPLYQAFRAGTPAP